MTDAEKKELGPMMKATEDILSYAQELLDATAAVIDKPQLDSELERNLKPSAFNDGTATE